MKILDKRFAPPRLLEFRSIFSNRDCLEELGFSTLHKIVLGLHGGSLLEQLTTFPDSIDITDHEAAERGDLETLTLLLSRNADPSSSNSQERHLRTSPPPPETRAASSPSSAPAPIPTPQTTDSTRLYTQPAKPPMTPPTSHPSSSAAPTQTR
jgi:ankyrin repeat protein